MAMDAAAVHRMHAGMVMVMPRPRHLEAPVPQSRAIALTRTMTVGAAGAVAAAQRSTTRTTVHHVTLELLATDGATPDFTYQQALAGVAQLNRFYEHETRGAITLAVDGVWDWITDPVKCADWASTFDDARKNVDWVPGRDKHLIIMLPTTVDCGYGGIGGEGSNVNSGESLITIGPSLLVTSHEFGHNLSLVHEGLLTCRGRSDALYVKGRWRHGCTTEEYGNAYDTMGAPEFMFDLSAPSLRRIRALPKIVTIAAGTTRKITLTPISGRFTALRAATFVDRTGTRYWIQARSTKGNAVFSPHPDAGDPDFPNGVQIIRTDPSEPGHDVTLQRVGDTSPTGRLFRDGDIVTLATGTTVRIDAVSSSRARVTITRPARS